MLTTGFVANSGSRLTRPRVTVVNGGGGGVQPFLEDDFSTYVNGSALTGQGSWIGGNYSGATVTNEIAPPGATQCMKCPYGPSVTTGTTEQNFDLGAANESQELWFEGMFYFTDGTEGLGFAAYDLNVGASNKFIVHWGYPDGNPNSARGSYDFNYYTHELWPSATAYAATEMHITPDARPGQARDVVTAATRGEWFQFRMHFKYADNGQTNGISEYWLNGTLLESMTTLNFQPASGHSRVFRYGYLMGSDSENFASDVCVYIGNVKWYNQDPGWT